MAVLTPTSAKGEDYFDGTKDLADYTHDDAADPMSGATYTHNAKLLSATEMDSLVSWMLWINTISQDPTGQVVFGGATADGVVTVKCASADGSTNGVTVVDSADAEVFSVNSDGDVSIGGTQVLTAQQSNVADASTSHSLNATYSNTEVESALDALGTTINNIISALEAHGLTASS